jgi:hypothetical protein
MAMTCKMKPNDSSRGSGEGSPSGAARAHRCSSASHPAAACARPLSSGYAGDAHHSALDLSFSLRYHLMVLDGSSSLVMFVLASLLAPLERCQILAVIVTVQTKLIRLLAKDTHTSLETQAP